MQEARSEAPFTKGMPLTPFRVVVGAAAPRAGAELVVAQTSVALTRTLAISSPQGLPWGKGSILASVSAGDHGVGSSSAWRPNVGTMPSVLSVTAADRAAAIDAAAVCSPGGADLALLPAAQLKPV